MFSIAAQISMMLSIFILKHFIVDFLLQTEYQWKNKGTFFHPGGVFHSLLHGLSTTFILFYGIDYLTDFGKPELIICFIIGNIDFLIHYMVDWGKININKKFNLIPEKTMFWVMLGLDQTLHLLTYVFIIFLIYSGTYLDFLIEFRYTPVIVYSIIISTFILIITFNKLMFNILNNHGDSKKISTS